MHASIFGAGTAASISPARSLLAFRMYSLEAGGAGAQAGDGVLVVVLAGSVVEGGALDVCSMAELVEGFGVETSVVTSAEVVVACDVSPVVAVELSTAAVELVDPVVVKVVLSSGRFGTALVHPHDLAQCRSMYCLVVLHSPISAQVLQNL